MPDPRVLDCENFEEFVQEALDERLNLSLSPDLQGHADGCPRCQETLARYQRLQGILTVAFSVPAGCEIRRPPADQPLPTRAVAASETDPLLANRRRRSYVPLRTSLPWLAAASVAILLTWTWQTGLRNSNDLSHPALVVQSPDNLHPEFAIHPVGNSRSIERCLEITAELPGIRPLQSTFTLAVGWCQDYFGPVKPKAELPSPSGPGVGRAPQGIFPASV